LDDRRGIAGCLEGLADLAVQKDQFERTARLLAAASMLREALNAPRAVDEAHRYDNCLALPRARLSTAELTAAWDWGQTTLLEQIVAYALGGAESA
jgi:hypothetical protein